VVEISQYSNLDLEAQTFGAHLGLVSRFCTFQRQKRTREFGLKFGLWCQELLRGRSEWSLCFGDYTDYSDSVVMK